MSTEVLSDTNDTRDITNSLKRIWVDGHRYIKAGVMLADFFSNEVAQLNLFDDNSPRTNSAALMETIDKLNNSGKGRERSGLQGRESKKPGL